MRRLLLLTLIPIMGCAAVLTSPPKPAPEPSPHVIISIPMRAFLSDIAARMEGNMSLPNMEQLLCVYGHIEGREIYIESLRPTTLLLRDSVSVEYEPCHGPGVLGTWHTHPTLDGYLSCAFSEADNESFREQDETVALISCDYGKRLIVKVRHGYSR